MQRADSPADTHALETGSREDAVHAALRTLRDRVPRVLEALALPVDGDARGWLQTLDTRLLPRLSPDFPLMVAIGGGGSSGKSTLFNSLLGAPLSTVGGRAGLNRRPLVAVHPEPLSRPDFLSELFRPFGTQPEPLVEREHLTTPGPPLYVATEALPPSVILLDTPDFDVGQGHEYLNRAVAEPVLTAADVLVYLFTNATYNAKANTDFLRSLLTRLGKRPCLLVYRVYASFSDDDVRAHAETVAENLYGPDWRPFVFGLFRADDSNAVASGEAPTEPRRVGPGAELMATLEHLDPRALRHEQNGALVAGAAAEAWRLAERARLEGEALALYRDGLRLAEAHAVAHALEHLPLSRIVERLRVIFERTDPGFLRFSRRVGRVTGAPLRGLLWLAGRRQPGGVAGAGSADPVELTRAALVEAANGLRRQVLAEELVAATTTRDPDGARLLERLRALRDARRLLGPARPLAESTATGDGVTVYVSAPHALASAREALLRHPWAEQLAAIARAAERLLEVPEALDDELVEIVREFRADLPFLKRARAALVASLNLLPPVLGVAYVLTTADPVGGTTIASKVSSLFGLNDLWATVSIPASTGLDEATRRDLKRLLDPAVQRWLQSRAKPVGALLREHVTGPVLQAADERLAAAADQLADIGAALSHLPRREESR